MTGWIDGKETADPTAVATIAKMLGASRNPLILVDAIDLAGAVTAVELARAAEATLDHAEPSNVRLMQDQGWLATTPGEAVLRGDTILFVGPLSPRLPTTRRTASSVRPETAASTTISGRPPRRPPSPASP